MKRLRPCLYLIYLNLKVFWTESDIAGCLLNVVQWICIVGQTLGCCCSASSGSSSSVSSVISLQKSITSAGASLRPAACLEGLHLDISRGAERLHREAASHYCLNICALSFNVSCQCWLPFASVISKAAIAHLGNVLCPYKVIGTGFPGTDWVLPQCQVPSVTSMGCSNTQQ